MDAGLIYGLFELFMLLIIIVLPIIISFIIFYHISKNKRVSIIGSIIGIIGTLVIGYGAGAIWIVIRLTGASHFPLAPIINSISMIIGTLLIGLVFIKLVPHLDNLPKK
ncbi:MAG TPA: hypothetical protein VIO58_06385 [Candidatus Methanoperedens sp.]